MTMRLLLIAIAVVTLGAACDKPQSGSESEKLEKFTERQNPVQDRNQIRFYAESEGKMRPIESDARALRERMSAGFTPSPEKAAALEICEAAIKEARAKVMEVKKRSTSDWEEIKPATEEAISRAQVAQKVMNDAP